MSVREGAEAFKFSAKVPQTITYENILVGLAVDNGGCFLLTLGARVQ
jgi:hypothetical protein